MMEVSLTVLAKDFAFSTPREIRHSAKHQNQCSSDRHLTSIWLSDNKSCIIKSIDYLEDATKVYYIHTVHI